MKYLGLAFLVLCNVCATRGPFDFRNCLKRMAGTTRLELATSAVTGQRSNQLNYVPAGITVTGMVGSAGLEPATSCL